MRRFCAMILMAGGLMGLTGCSGAGVPDEGPPPADAPSSPAVSEEAANSSNEQ